MCLDKDILYKGNKIYSPKNCVFAPNNINTLFISCNSKRGDFPIGVTFNKRDKIFIAQCNDKTGRKHIGRFSNAEDAFYKGYKPFKEHYIKEVAEDYKDQIPQNLYNAMYNYKIEITD